jgi:hypothetical protein
MIVLCENISSIMAISRVSYSRIFPVYSFIFQGRGEVIKKYGFLPSQSHLISSSSDTESNTSEDEQASRFFVRNVYILRNTNKNFNLFFFLTAYSNSQNVLDRNSGGFSHLDYLKLSLFSICMISQYIID